MSTQVTVVENGVQVEVTGTLPVTAAQLAALNAADAPGSSNPLLTESAGDARYQAAPIADSDLPSTIARDTEVAASIGAHAGATDPHGDRDYANGLAVNYDAAGAAATAVSNHAGATDPHGDRAYTTSQIATHAGAADPHGDRSFASGLSVNYEAAGAVSAGISAHNSLLSAHGRMPLSRFTWAWNNQGASVVSENGGCVQIGAEASGGSTTYSMRTREAVFDGSGDFEIIGKSVGFASTVVEYGILVRNGSIVYDFYWDSLNLRFGSRTAPNAATRTVIGSVSQPASAVAQTWLMIKRVGSTIQFLYSYDGVNWISAGTATDSSAMDHCGIFGENRAASGTTYSACTAFSITPSPV